MVSSNVIASICICGVGFAGYGFKKFIQSAVSEDLSKTTIEARNSNRTSTKYEDLAKNMQLKALDSMSDSLTLLDQQIKNRQMDLQLERTNSKTAALIKKEIRDLKAKVNRTKKTIAKLSGELGLKPKYKIRKKPKRTIASNRQKKTVAAPVVQQTRGEWVCKVKVQRLQKEKRSDRKNSYSLGNKELRNYRIANTGKVTGFSPGECQDLAYGAANKWCFKGTDALNVSISYKTGIKQEISSKPIPCLRVSSKKGTTIVKRKKNKKTSRIRRQISSNRKAN